MSSGGSTKSVTQNYSPEEAARRAALMKEAERMYAGGQLNSTWSNAAPVGFSGLTQAAQGQYVGAAGTQQAQANTANNSLNWALNSAIDVQNNPYLDRAIEAATRPQQVAMTQGLQQISSAAQQQGAYGGARQGITESLGLQKGLQAIGDTSAQMGSEAYGQGLDMMKAGLTLAPQIQAMQTTPGTTLSAVGNQQETLAQALADYNAAENAWNQDTAGRALERYGNIVYSGGGSQSSSTAQGGSNKVVGALGGAATGAALASTMYGSMAAAGPAGWGMMAAGALLGFM